jgi:hypothetical protein
LVFDILRKGILFKDDNKASRDDWIQDKINSNGFSFDMNDISELRTELQLLIENLSVVYSSWKQGGSPESAANSIMLSNVNERPTRSIGSTEDSKPKAKDISNQIIECKREIDFGAAATPPTRCGLKLESKGEPLQISKSAKNGDEEEDEGFNTAATSPADHLKDISTSTDISRSDNSFSSCEKNENNSAVQNSQLTINDSTLSIAATLQWSEELPNIVNPGAAPLVNGLNVIDTESI